MMDQMPTGSIANLDHECNTTEDPERVFSYYEGPITNTTPKGRPIKLEELYEAVRDGKWANLVDKVRPLAKYKAEKVPGRVKKDGTPGNPVKSDRAEAYTTAKNKLPYTVPSGVYEPQHRHGPSPQTGKEHLRKFPECADGGPIPHAAVRPALRRARRPRRRRVGRMAAPPS